MALKRSWRTSCGGEVGEIFSSITTSTSCWFFETRLAIAVPVAKPPLGEHSTTLPSSGLPSRSTYWQGAKVSIEQARAIALQARAGAITDEELEHEKGGSGLRYSFDIKGGSAVYEVGVDAQTGKVLENKKEGPHPH
jgi:hypothetical protein